MSFLREPLKNGSRFSLSRPSRMMYNHIRILIETEE